MSNETEFSLTINGKTITLRGSESLVREELRRLTDLFTRMVQEEKQPDVAAPRLNEPVDNERDIFEQKRPRTQTETVAVLAFALTQAGKAEFTEEDIRRAYIRAGVRPPESVGQALRDARSKNDFIEWGAKRGLYRLSAHGDRTVRFDLPRNVERARP